jgi:hypothetical protein
VIIPDNNFIKAIKSCIINFLWKSGIQKIKYNVMISEYIEGGMKMPDIEMLIQTHKINWIKRYLSEAKGLWRIIPEFYFKRAGVISIGNNINVKYVSKKLPEFYNSCLSDWALLFSVPPDDTVSVLSQPLWHNRYITADNIPVYYKQMSQAGYNFVKDLINNDGTFRSFANLHISQSLLFKWLVLKHSITKQWSGLLTDCSVVLEENPPLITKQCHYSLKQLTTKEIYSALVFDKKEIPTGQVALQNMINENTNVQNVDWPNAYFMINKTTIYTKLREFQYKLLHNILPVNHILYKWKLIDSERCSYCFINAETLDHLFCFCPKVVTFYLLLKEWFQTYGINLPCMKVKDILLGDLSGSENCLIVNHALLLYKQIVYNSRDDTHNLSLAKYINILTNTEKTERQIAKNRGKLALHLKKWGKILGALDV